MKKLLAAISLLTCLSISARAQVIIFNDNVLQGRLSEIKASVVDSLTNEPVVFASVYVIPSRDTTITNFTLTDSKGCATLEDVPFGSYVFRVEMMGYKPFVKEQYFRESNVDLGTIMLQTDEQFLDAAVVSDVGNPIIVKQDTVEFNASSFHVSSNAMLKDLLQRMPGMEVTSDGKVRFNGESIDKLTVGGRTFFFNDQSTALNNLPASVVDKIRVIDRESEQTRASGLEDGSREKVLDVALKKEYEQGWFGNVGIKAGVTLGEKEGDDVLRDDRGLLWNGNALVSAYNEKDQVTLIANGQNIDDSNTVVVVISENGERSSLNQGLSSAAQFGANVNTSRIKDVETTVGANYKYTDTDSGTRADRTTYQQGGDLSSTTEDTGKSYANSVSASLEFQKETGNVWFHFRPSFSFDRSDAVRNSSSETFREGSFVNSSTNSTHGISESRNGHLTSDITFREIAGKQNRTLRLAFSGSYTSDSGESTERSLLSTAGSQDARALKYVSDGFDFWLGGGLRYTEPLGEKWSLSSSADITWIKRESICDAFDNAGRNDYYSSVSRTPSLSQMYDLTAQYKPKQGIWITIGGRLSGIHMETYSKSFGIEETTGKDDWNWFLSPTVRFQHSNGAQRFTFDATGYSQRPPQSRMLPVLNISNPSRLSLGNIYLKPYSQTSFSANWTSTNLQKFSTILVYLSGQVNYRPVSSALWYDADGILYSIPVNAARPGVNSNLTLNYTSPIDTKRLWTLTLSGEAGYSFTQSYQTESTLPGLDKDTFDYSAFMADFWGNAEGDRFYGGKSGFTQSNTSSLSPTASVSVKYNPKRWSMTLSARAQGYVARYSLNPQANLNTLTTRLRASGSYTTKHEFEFSSNIAYVFYNGYPAGYGQPEWRWNAEISKNIGAFNLSVKVHDILNQTTNLTHTVTANYAEDSYRLIMGRYVLFGVKWNFGKMNAAHSARAQSAAMSMVF